MEKSFPKKISMDAAIKSAKKHLTDYIEKN
jgi:hypothetical protein